MDCRPGCGACCVAPSISTPLPGMPRGKAAGERCVNLDPATHLCRLWDSEAYPEVCRRFVAEAAVCGASRAEALELLAILEIDSSPGT
jgi:Fe-S-cluster containining protein